MAPVRTLAAANNAAWCDVVCRTHRLEPVFQPDAWTSAARTPLLYPDAVTLVPDVSVPALLDRVDRDVGCSIKDSFGSLDLTAFGFQVLFEAQWIMQELHEARPVPAEPTWRVVRDADSFEPWQRAWERDGGASGVLTADLLDEESVVVLAGHLGDDLVAGGVLMADDDVVGISNFFALPGLVDSSWNGLLASASTLFAGAVLVGYESGHALGAAVARGFSVAGPLRVWVRDE